MRFLIALCTSFYCGAAMAFLVAQRQLADPPWWFALAGDFTVLVFLPIPLLLVVALIARSRLALLLLLAPIAVFVRMNGELFLPDRTPRTVQPTFTIRTHNLWSENQDLEAELREIAAERPDIAAFVEIPDAFVGEMDRRLAATYPYRAIQATPIGEQIAIMSRFPLERRDCYRPAGTNGCWLRVTVLVDGRPVDVIVVHADRPYVGPRGGTGLRRVIPQVYDRTVREDQMGRFAAWLPSIPTPFVVVGDFNMTPDSSEYRILAPLVVDVHRAVGGGLGHTFPGNLRVSGNLLPPLMRIDYVFVSPNVVPVRVTTGDPGGSDHLPVTAALALPLTPR